MRKMICLLLAFCMVFALGACGEKKTEHEIKEWTRQGYFMDENENMLSVTWMEDVDEPGWYVGLVLGEDWIEDAWGGMLPKEGNTLHGTLPSSGSKGDLTVTISEEGEDDLLLTVEGGETYHFKGSELPQATVMINVNTEGWGYIAYAEGEDTPEIDTEYPAQSAYIGLAEPAVYTFYAWPQAGNVFIKWTKDGEDFSAEPQLTLLLDESAEYVAVFEEDPDWQNPVMNVIGDYQCGRAHAAVRCAGFEDAWITIGWGSSAWELTQWDIFGTLDTDTMTIAYSGCTKSNIVYDENGEVKSQKPEYEGGTGTIVFNGDGTFTWHEDQAGDREDMVFEWLPVEEEPYTQLANPWAEITEEEANAACPALFKAPAGAADQTWMMCEDLADPSTGVGPMIQLSFVQYGMNFTARAQEGVNEDADISGLYTEWTVGPDAVILANWGDEPLSGKMYRAINDTGYIDLITWYDPSRGVKYSLSVAAADLDGFDIQAVAEQMHAEKNS